MNVYIAGISSDIGSGLGLLYQNAGQRVFGTYNNNDFVTDIFGIETAHYNGGKVPVRPWDMFIGCIGTLTPIRPFFSGDFAEWQKAIEVNALSQLKLLHGMWAHRGKEPKAVFLVGGGISRPFPNYSAYSLSKILLVAAVEKLCDENPELHAVAIGTGWVNTKIHQQTLEAKDCGNKERTLEALKKANSIEAVYAFINKCLDDPKTRGRNLAIGDELDIVGDEYKLRRSERIRLLPP